MARTAKKRLPTTIATRRNGRPANYPLTDRGPYTEEGAKAAGFAVFNGNSHLCIDVPDDWFTVSCRTSEGRRITFAFIPYKAGGPAQCVDIQYHDSPVLVDHNDEAMPAQSFIGFGPKREDVRYSRHATKPCTLLTVILADKCPSRTEPLGIYEDAHENLVLCRACGRRSGLRRIDVASDGDKCQRCGTDDNNRPTGRVSIPVSKLPVKP